jgi:hypothetical protein
MPRTQQEFDALLTLRTDKFHKKESFDSWGQPMIYRWPSSSPDRAYDLYSAGANGMDERGEGDDVAVWNNRGYHRQYRSWSDLLVIGAMLLDGPLLLVVVVVMSVRHRKWRARAAASGA